MSEITFTSDITVELVDTMGGDWSVVAAAKVSTCGEDAVAFANPNQAEANAGLINYLMSQRHGTPFEHSSLTFFVHAPIFVWRQWQRHRIGVSYNEESGRYRKLEPVFWIPRRDRKMVPVKGFKAARPEFEEASKRVYEMSLANKRSAYIQAWNSYEADLSLGIASEVARVVLPVAIYSSCWVTTNPRALMSFLSLRTHDPDAKFVSFPQAEIEECGRACEAILAEGWPLTYASFVKNGRVAP